MNEETANCTICRQPLGENGRCAHCDNETHIWTIQDWRPLLTLSLVIVLGFSFTSLVVSNFRDKENALASEYYLKGNRALDAKHPAEAVTALETALVYSHDNFRYQLSLTDALLASGATSEALAQLHSFWAQRPHDALVNLKLARLEAKRNQVDEAIRYYQNAVEGEWPEQADELPQRIGVRFEAAEYLIREGRNGMAESALVELASVLPSASLDQSRLASLFLRNGDPGRALMMYQAQLNMKKNDPVATLGAAQASLAGGSYAMARHYLEEMKPETAESHALREQLERMEALDPFAPNATGAVRTARTMAAFHIAVERLAGCGVPFAQAMSHSAKSANAKDPAQWSGFATWAQQLLPMMSERKLRGRDEVIESTMRFAFQAEVAAKKGCGTPTLNDEALLLLARERLGAE
jgi:tetratricopeptide (TPR) repeat protein